MDSRNLVTSIVTCDLPEAYGRAEHPFFTRIDGPFTVREEIQSNFECLDRTGMFCRLNIDWCSLFTLWATEGSSVLALAGFDTNPISWSTSDNTYGWRVPLDAFVVWSLHA